MSAVPALVAFAAAMVFYLRSVRGAVPLLTGDEPSYLALSDSLRHFTLDVTASYRGVGGPSRWLPGLTADQAVTVGGSTRSNRLPALPLLLVPAMLLKSLVVVRLTMIVIWTVMADQLWRLLSVVRSSTWVRALAWACVLFSFPILAMSSAVYPEIPGALLVIVAIRGLAWRTDPGWRRNVTTIAAAVLPWLIIRFAWLAIALTLAAIVVDVRERERAHFASQVGPGSDLVGVATVASRSCIPLAISGAVLLAYLRILYHSWSPQSIYPPGGTHGWSAHNAYTVGVGSIIGQSQGLVAYAPALLVAVACVIPFLAGMRRWGIAAAIVISVQLLVVNPVGFYGQSLPGRFVVVVAPLLAVALAAVAGISGRRGTALLAAAIAVNVLVVGMLRDRFVEVIISDTPIFEYQDALPAVTEEHGIDRIDERLLPTSTDVSPATIDRYSTNAQGMRPGPWYVELSFDPATAIDRPNTATVRAIQLPEGWTIAEQQVTVVSGRSGFIFNVAPLGVRDTTGTMIQVDVDTGGPTPREVHGQPSVPLPSREERITDDRWKAIVLVALFAAASVLSERPKVRTPRRLATEE